MASKTTKSSSIVVESIPSLVVDVYKQILSKLEGNNFGKEDIFAVRLALQEAFSNAVRHGNKMDPTKKIKINYSVGPDKIEISITDQGDGFNPEVIPDPRAGKNIFKPEGRGLLLMRSYMDAIKFNKRGNSVYMVRYKEKPSIPAYLAEGRSRSKNADQIHNQ